MQVRSDSLGSFLFSSIIASGTFCEPLYRFCKCVLQRCHSPFCVVTCLTSLLAVPCAAFGAVSTLRRAFGACPARTPRFRRHILWDVSRREAGERCLVLALPPLCFHRKLWQFLPCLLRPAWGEPRPSRPLCDRALPSLPAPPCALRRLPLALGVLLPCTPRACIMHRVSKSVLLIWKISLYVVDFNVLFFSPQNSPLNIILFWGNSSHCYVRHLFIYAF